MARNPYRERKSLGCTDICGMAIVACCFVGMVGAFAYDVYGPKSLTGAQAASKLVHQKAQPPAAVPRMKPLVPEKKEQKKRKLSPAEKAKLNVDNAYEQMAYYTRPKSTPAQLRAAFPTDTGKYLTFETDTGGFNNIRMVSSIMASSTIIEAAVVRLERHRRCSNTS